MVRRLVEACVDGVVFLLALWGVWSVIGAPTWTHHHLTDVLIYTGFAVAIVSFGKASAS